MPNSDTLGSIYRTTFEKSAKSSNSIILIENFGSQSYFTAMNHSKLLIGNSSSGILEAASFNKFVLNLGDRQKNRACGENVIHLSIKFENIIEATEMYINREYLKKNIYSQQNGVSTLIDQLKIELNEL
jgi:GDP/UDP-N,N'-diacetylbacillosamine 2-epimerase (hydrolysing)